MVAVLSLLRLIQVPSRNSYSRSLFQRSFSSLSTLSGGSNADIPALINSKHAIDLLANDGAQNIKFVDGSWHLDPTRNASAEYIQERISGASFLNIDEASDHSTDLPHMIPTADHFSEYVSDLGITSEDHIVVYTTNGCSSGARVWWMFKLFGHDKVSMLNGGIMGWKAAGGPVESGPPNCTTADKQDNNKKFEAKLKASYVADLQQVLTVVDSGAAQILDARSKGRFLGEAPEPRPIPSGHIPGSLCIPFPSVLAPDDVTTFRPLDEIRQVFDEAGIVFGSKVIFTCGSGVTAANLCFAMYLLGAKMEDMVIYDGSWTEWVTTDNVPKVLKK